MAAVSEAAAARSAAARAPAVVMWVREDARLRDHAPLWAAQGAGDSGAPGVVVAATFSAGCTARPAAALRRAALVELSAALRERGALVAVRPGPAPVAVGEALGVLPAGALVIAHAAASPQGRAEERDVLAVVQRKGATLLLLHGLTTLLHPAAVPPDSALPEGGLKWIEAAEALAAPLPEPLDLDLDGALPRAPDSAAEALGDDVPELDERWWAASGGAVEPSAGGVDVRGGESAALERLRDWVWGPGLESYDETRDALEGRTASSRLSPWLARGCLSAAHVAREIRAVEAARGGETPATRWALWELRVRDYFLYFARRHGARLLEPGGVSGEEREWTPEPEAGELFERWRTGTTGVPLVDAAMRELNATGWVSNRARQVAASFLALTLGVDWRRGARYFEDRLVDHDPALNWGNWVVVAGLRTKGARLNRFNAAAQGRKHDPSGDYVRRWVPELAGLAEGAHEPWTLDRPPAGYPAPPPRALEKPPPSRKQRRAQEQRDRGAGRRGAGSVELHADL